MKFFQGLHIDNFPGDQPENTYRDAKNIVIYKKQGAVNNELGTEQLAALPAGYVPIGKIVLPSNQVVVFLAGEEGDSEIGLLKNSEYSTVLNHADLNFDPAYPIVGTFRILSSEKESDELPGISDTAEQDVQIGDTYNITISEGGTSVVVGELQGEAHAEGFALVSGTVTVQPLQGEAHAEGTVEISLSGISYTVGPLEGWADAEGGADVGGIQIPAPVNLQACNNFNFHASIYWDPVPDAVSYILQRSTNPYTGFQTIYTGSNPFYGDSFVTSSPSTYYYYRVRAVDSFGGESDNSQIIEVQFNTLASCS